MSMAFERNGVSRAKGEEQADLQYCQVVREELD